MSSLSNILSFSRIFFAPITALLVANGRFFFLPIILFTIASITDFLDGYVARKLNSSTAFGAFIDPLADKILIISMLIAFYSLGAIPLWVVIAITVRDTLITLLRVLTMTQGSALVTSSSAKFKTTLQFILIYFLFLLTFFSHNQIYSTIVNVMVYGIVGFTLWTGASYIIANRHMFKNII